MFFVSLVVAATDLCFFVSIVVATAAADDNFVDGPYSVMLFMSLAITHEATTKMMEINILLDQLLLFFNSPNYIYLYRK